MLWDVRTGTNLATLTGHTAGVTGVAISPDGETLFSCGLDRTIRLWNMRTREQVALLSAKEKLACLALSPDGRSLVSGSGWWNDLKAVSEVTFWELNARRAITNIVGAAGMVRAINFSPDGKTVAIGLVGDLSLELCDAASKEVVFTSTNSFVSGSSRCESTQLTITN